MFPETCLKVKTYSGVDLGQKLTDFWNNESGKAQASRESGMLPGKLFNIPKGPFLSFWVIQAGHWLVLFSLDETLRIGGECPNQF